VSKRKEGERGREKKSNTTLNPYGNDRQATEQR